MFFNRIDGKDGFFRKDELRVTPELPPFCRGGEATCRSLSWDEMVLTDHFHLTFSVSAEAAESCVRLARGTVGCGGIGEGVGDGLDNSGLQMDSI
jgi:hypothetical protein